MREVITRTGLQVRVPQDPDEYSRLLDDYRGKPLYQGFVGHNEAQVSATAEGEVLRYVANHVLPSMPAILQMPDYTEALFRTGGVEPSRIPRAVAARVGRSSILLAKRVPHDCLTHENVLRPVGAVDSAILLDQLEHTLNTMDQHQELKVRIVPKKVMANLEVTLVYPRERSGPGRGFMNIGPWPELEAGEPLVWSEIEADDSGVPVLQRIWDIAEAQALSVDNSRIMIEDSIKHLALQL